MKPSIAILLISTLWSCNNCRISSISNDQTPCEVVTSSDALIVKTTAGRVSGYYSDGVYIYKGIPYAQAERFMPPVAPAKWETVRSCCAYGPVAPQGERSGWADDRQAFWFDWDDGFQREDCQRLNIWTKSVNDSAKRSVMVWLHGGGYSAGSSQELPSYDGTNLAKKDVVLVSVNHRLNVLGFLDLSAFGEKYVSSGNVGMLDIVAALKWVKNNISQFGGDPDNVTIFGQSGGGGKVSTLMAMADAKGLFHKAIIESGATDRIMESRYSRRIGVVTLEELGLNATELNRLNTLPYAELLAAGERAVKRVSKEAADENPSVNQFLFGWSPTIDGTVLTQHPFNDSAPEMSVDVPVIVGTTQNEFMFYTLFNPELQKCTEEAAREVLTKLYGNDTDNYIAAYAEAYPNHIPRDLLDIDTRFRPLAIKLADLKSIRSDGKVYMYLFNWKSPTFNGLFRSFHCIELPFVFNNVGRCRGMTGGTPEAYRLAEAMSSSWVAFAQTGNPNCSSMPEWEPYESNRRATMIFDNHIEQRYGHDNKLMNIIKKNSH